MQGGGECWGVGGGYVDGFEGFVYGFFGVIGCVVGYKVIGCSASVRGGTHCNSGFKQGLGLRAP